MICKKKKYKDKISAMFALSQCKRGKGHRQEIRLYYCNECKAWHLTKIQNWNNYDSKGTYREVETI